jgi:nicotinamide-nucleotide amidase
VKAAIFTVGDELVCGYRLDTNSQALSRRLSTLPLEVVLHLSVGDDAARMRRGLRMALEEVDVVIVTGGLGPTEDDMTRQVIAGYFGRELVEDAEALARMRERFARYGDRPMRESNRVQAHVPAGSRIIQNERGTAAGFYVEAQGKHVFATPGIPYEMEGMLERFILPRLRELTGAGRHTVRGAVKVYGLPESEINERIQPMMERDRNPLLGLLPHRGTITIEVVATAETAEEARALVEADVAALKEQLGRYVISDDERDLPAVVAGLLTAHELSIATAELGTGGLVAARLTEPDGYARWFRHSAVVDPAQAAAGMAPDERLTDEAMAAALATVARRTSQADLGVGVAAVDMKDDVDPRRPYGTIHVVVDLRGQRTGRNFPVNGGRAHVREWVADRALALVRWAILDWAESQRTGANPD